MQNTTKKEKERRDHPPAILNNGKEEVKSRRSKGALQETNNPDKLINQSTFGADFTSHLYLLHIIQVFIKYQIYIFQERRVFCIPHLSLHTSVV
uniref:Putative ovule protein n=1 Tax=Solanum chacoense TaxID=4108 RepID=A0A0V0H3S8_SOLCH